MHTKDLKISVVVPSYNQARFLEGTLLSVLRQNYPALELIVIDGGSTDGSVDIIKRYERHIEHWVSEPDGGQTKGLIKGFNRATGAIQCWLNSDDLLADGCLQEVADYFRRNPAVDMVFGDALWIDEQGAPLREQREIPFNRFIWLYTHNYIPGMSAFWRSEIYERVGGLNPHYNLAMDADLWIRFADVGRIEHVSRVWSHMRFYPEQKNRALRRQSNQEDLEIRARYWGTQSPSFLNLKRTLAQTYRVMWKLATGCYPMNYRRHLDRVNHRVRHN